MPAQFLIADYMNELEHICKLEQIIYQVQLTTHLDLREKIRLIEEAYVKTIWILDKIIIPELKKPEYLRKSNLAIPEIMHQVLNPRGTIFRFLEAERSLLEISGWHDSQIDNFVQYIINELPNIKKKANLIKLLEELESLKSETEEQYKAFKNKKAQETMWFEKIVPIVGGTALIILNLKAAVVIGDIYSIVSVGVGTNIASNGIQKIFEKKK